jgi:hypothetical protein
MPYFTSFGISKKNILSFIQILTISTGRKIMHVISKRDLPHFLSTFCFFFRTKRLLSHFLTYHSSAGSNAAVRIT